MTVRDLLIKAFRTVHILGADEPMDATDATDAFDTLNGILEQAVIDKLLGFYQTGITFSTVSNQLSYTIGPASTTPDITAPRPVEILSGYSTRANVDLPFFVTHDREDYGRIQMKQVQVAGWEQVLYYERAFPKGTLYLYPKPIDTATTITLNVMADIAQFAALGDTVSFPPAYRVWLQYKTAERLAPEFGLPFTEQMNKILIDIEGALKRNNIKPMPVAATGLVSLAKAGGQYNVFSDTMR